MPGSPQAGTPCMARRAVKGTGPASLVSMRLSSSADRGFLGVAMPKIRFFPGNIAAE